MGLRPISWFQFQSLRSSIEQFKQHCCPYLLNQIVLTPYCQISDYTDGYFFGTQSLTCLFVDNIWKKDSIPPFRNTLEFSHRLVYYRNAVYEFGPSGVYTYNVPDWKAALICAVKWESTPAGNSNCSEQSLTDYLAGYTGRYGIYKLFTNNCHIFANRVSAFLSNTVNGCNLQIGETDGPT